MAAILVADDNVALLKAVVGALRAEGHVVTSTNNGADALCLIHGPVRHDLVLLDIIMPGMDGIEVVKSLGPSDPPIIIMTGSGDLPASVPENERVKRIVTKPMDLTAVLEAVNDVLAGNPPRPSQEATPC